MSSDAWTRGVAYEAYMGRWSRELARRFLAWLEPGAGGHWLEVGCGTGALTSIIAAHGRPASIVACDPSAAFLEHARHTLADARLSFVIAGAESLPGRAGGFDAIVSGLVLNFLAEPVRALEAMRERLRLGGRVACYVWDYSQVEFLHRFWDAATELDPSAAPFHESTRFGTWQPFALERRLREAGFARVDATVIEIATPFADFDAYWTSFLGGAGPAPVYVASLNASRRELLRTTLLAKLAPTSGGPLSLRARASAARGVAP